MLAAQKPTAPSTASPPRDGLRTKSIAVRVPLASVAGTLASRCARRLEPVSLREAREAALEVVGNQRDQQDDDQDRSPAIAAGTIVSPTGASPLSTPVRSRTPKTTSASM